MNSQESVIKAARYRSLPSHMVCLPCKGTGSRYSKVAGGKVIPCPDCGGSGKPPADA